MSRWRPPTEKSSPYITAEGYQDLESELASLWKKRRVVNDALAAAAAEGDRSENAEYIYRKKEQAEIDRRIRYLQKRLPELSIVNEIGDPSKIFFGAWITLMTECKQRLCYRIVGPDEATKKPDYISVDAPLAKALLGKQIDEQAAVMVADKQTLYTVLHIDYRN